jgi:hypothetical protein
MPLLDHFHPPLDERYPWESFHSNWATRIADYLSERLPAEFVAAEYTHGGMRLEIDVATFESKKGTDPTPGSDGASAATVAVAAPAWAPPAAAYALPALFPDAFEVRVYTTMGGLTLVGAIELVSPGNKDRPDERRAFASKCAAYLQKGVSVIMIDIVTSRRANLHNELIRLLNVGETFELPADAGLYAVAYRPVLRKERPEIDVWPATFHLGESLPTLPLRLTGDLFVPVDFEAAYQEACRRRRLT